MALMHHCSHTLERINVSFVHSISLPAFLHFIGVCTGFGKLETVSLWGCSQLHRAVVDSRLREESILFDNNNDEGAGSSVTLLSWLKRQRIKAGTHEEKNSDRIPPSIIGFLDS